MYEFVSSITATAKGLAASAKGLFDSVTGAIDDFFAVTPRHGIYLNDSVTEMFNWPGIGIMAIDITRNKSVASHPLEINKSVQDNVIFEPIEASVSLLVEAGQLDKFYTYINQLFTDNSLFSIKVDDNFYPELLLSSLPIQREPGVYDALQVTLSFHEYIQKRSIVSEMSDPDNVELARYSDRQKAGLQRPQTVSGADEIRVKANKTVPGS